MPSEWFLSEILITLVFSENKAIVISCLNLLQKKCILEFVRMIWSARFSSPKVRRCLTRKESLVPYLMEEIIMVKRRKKAAKKKAHRKTKAKSHRKARKTKAHRKTKTKRKVKARKGKARKATKRKAHKRRRKSHAVAAIMAAAQE